MECWVGEKGRASKQGGVLRSTLHVARWKSTKQLPPLRRRRLFSLTLTSSAQAQATLLQPGGSGVERCWLGRAGATRQAGGRAGGRAEGQALSAWTRRGLQGSI